MHVTKNVYLVLHNFVMYIVKGLYEIKIVNLKHELVGGFNMY